MGSKDDVWNTILAIAGIGLPLFALTTNEVYRVYIVLGVVILILAFVVGKLFTDIKTLEEDGKKNSEKLEIYKDLILIKADIDSLKKERLKK